MLVLADKCPTLEVKLGAFLRIDRYHETFWMKIDGEAT
jgi:hypothetical protein